MMRAVWYDRMGPAREVLVLGDHPVPHPAPGEIRVRLHASGVNPADCNRRGGRGYAAMGFPRVIPNSDGAGTVDGVGEGLDPAMIGRRVWIYNAQRGRAFGTAAEYACIPAGFVADLPDDVSFEAGACLGIPCMTAHRCLFADGPVDGLTVLVTGGGGAVGNYAIQLARWGGAELVIATSSGGWKTEDAIAAGAHHVIDYRRENVVALLRELTGGRGVDRVVEVDLGGNCDTWAQVVALNGVVAGYASRGDRNPVIPVSDLMRRNVTIRTVLLNNAPIAGRRHAQRDIVAWLQQAPRLHRIAGRFALAETAAAHEAVEAGTKRGTVVVLPAG